VTTTEPRTRATLRTPAATFTAALPSAEIGSPTVRGRYTFDYDVAIVGLGYVGLPTALAYHHAGVRVLALDASDARLQVITTQTADLLDSDRARLALALQDPRFTITADASLLERAKSIIVCVPTPVDEHLVPDLAPLRGACATVVQHARKGQLVMLTSTSYVGCTEDLLVAPLTDAGFGIGTDICVAFSPERIDPGNSSVDHDDVPRVVGAVTPQCLTRAVHLLRRYAGAVHPVESLEAAEMTKLVENTFRAVNIALANEFADICRALGISVADVIDAASTKPYGYMAFTPGPGVGGHCIPCDPHYLLWQLKTRHIDAPMISQAMVEIAARPGRVIDRVLNVLSGTGRGLHDARVLVAGVAYKPNVADLRESPALEILEGLARRGAEIAYLDAYIPQVRLRDGTVLESIADPAAFGADVVILHTRHDSMDLGWIDPAALVLDTTYRETSIPTRITL
jgi:nucleotide sugar dehydrogenase